jgi:hypothetical protein
MTSIEAMQTARSSSQRSQLAALQGERTYPETPAVGKSMRNSCRFAGILNRFSSSSFSTQ